MPNTTPSLDTVFCEAVEIADADARAAYLARACGTDAGLRQRIEALLEAHNQAGSFLDGPAEALAAAAVFTPGLDPSDAEEPGSIIGPYTLVEKVGEGGMGAVFVADQTTPVKRRVALKVIKPGMDTREVVARFEAERQALALMDHPNIATVLDAGTTDQGRPYFVMELVHGLPISEYCDQARLATNRRLRLFAQVCRAVQHAHQKGVIHRDLKPSNVLVTLHDGEPVPKVIDFGVAKAVNQPLTDKSEHTRLAQLVGTPAYMSPEQAGLNGLDVDTRADVYGLGVLLYELLTGTTPFDQETLLRAGFDELRRVIREDEPPRPSQRVSTLDAAARTSVSARRGLDERRLSRLLRGDLDWVVMKALEKDRDRRYESAGAFAADVERYLAGRPVEARPPSAAYRLRKFLLRNRVAVAMSAILVAAALAVAGTLGWTAHARSADRAEAARRADEFLADADRLEQAGRWADALALVERAEAVLGATADAGLRDRVLQRKRRLALVLRAGSIRLEMATMVEEGSEFKLGDRLYAEAFREYGLDVDALSPANVAARLPEGVIGAEVVAILDDWARVRRESGDAADQRWEHLLAAARAADPDPWRDRMRVTWQHQRIFFLHKLNESREKREDRTIAIGRHSRRDEAALKELTATAQLDRLHPAMVIFFLEVAGDKPEALTMLRDAQRRRPGDFWLNHTLAIQLRSEPREAIPFYRAALALQPESPGLLLDLGKVLCESGQFDEAIAIYNRALRLKPDFAAAYNNLGAALFRKGAYDESIAACREAIRLDPSFWFPYCNLAKALDRRGRLREAVDALREATRRRPASDRPFVLLGDALSKLGAADEAIAAYREAIRLNPNSAATYNSLGGVLSEQKRDYDGAIAALRRAVELSPSHSTYHNNLGVVLARKGALDPAITAYREAIRLKPDDVSARQGLTNVLIRKRAWDEAITLGRESVRLQPETAGFHDLLARALCEKGDLDGAVAAYRAAIRVKPDEYRWHYNLCILFIQKRAWADAAASAREAIRVKPGYADAHCGLGQALREQERYQEALAAFRRGHELGSRNPGWRHPSAQWIKECEVLAAAEKHNASQPRELAPPPREVASPPRPRD